MNRRQHVKSGVRHSGKSEWEGCAGLASWPSQVANQSQNNTKGSKLQQLTWQQRCGSRASGEQTLLAGVCVLAGLATALAIVAAVHCQRRVCLRCLEMTNPLENWKVKVFFRKSENLFPSWPPCSGSRSSPCCETDSCEKYRGGTLTSPRGSPLEQVDFKKRWRKLSQDANMENGISETWWRRDLSMGESLVLKVASSILHLHRYSNRLIVLISLILDALILP